MFEQMMGLMQSLRMMMLHPILGEHVLCVVLENLWPPRPAVHRACRRGRTLYAATGALLLRWLLLGGRLGLLLGLPLRTKKNAWGVVLLLLSVPSALLIIGVCLSILALLKRLVLSIETHRLCAYS